MLEKIEGGKFGFHFCFPFFLIVSFFLFSSHFFSFSFHSSFCAPDECMRVGVEGEVVYMLSRVLLVAFFRLHIMAKFSIGERERGEVFAKASVLSYIHYITIKSLLVAEFFFESKSDSL